MSDFIAAARGGDLAKVKAMLATDRSLLHARDEMKNTAFHEAADKGHEDLVSIFIKEGCDVHDLGAYGRTVLMRAAECSRDNSRVVRMLVKAGAMVNDRAQNESRTSALHLAAQSSVAKTIKTLIQCGADVHMKDNRQWQPLHGAAWCRSVDELEELIKVGIEINPRSSNNNTPMINGAHGNKPGNIKLLHMCGGDINSIDKDGMSALHIASDKQHQDCVSLLLSLGARTDVKDQKGRTPLDVARQKNNTEIVELLEKTDHIPPLHRACSEGNVPQLTKLLRTGHDPNEADKLGRTALHIAVINKNIPLIKFLLKHKADADVQDVDWVAAMHIACINGFVPAIQALVEMADINIVEQNGLTPAMLAAKWSKYDILQILLPKKEIDLKCQDVRGNTVLHYAAQSGDEKMMKLLLSVRPPPSLVSRNADNDSPLVVAARNHHAVIVRLILLELVPESNIERSLTTFTRSTRGLDASVRILPTNLAIEVIHNTLDDDLVQFVLDYKDKFDL